MKLVVFVLSLFICIKTISYGIYEFKTNQNKFGGIIVIVFAIIASILPNIIVVIKGI